MTDRKAAYNALKRVCEGGYSTLALDAVLSGSDLDRRDRAFASAIFYGVLENADMLDYVIAKFTKADSKIEKRARIILRMGLYQMIFMDKVPDSAAVNESVSLAKSVGLGRASGFINAVLRSFIRAGKKCELPSKEDNEVLHLSLKYSVPQWLVEKWMSDYGSEICESVLGELSGRPPLYVRMNSNRTNKDEFLESLAKNDVKANSLTWLEGAFALEECGDIEEIGAFKDGLFHVQDAASQLCCAVLNPQTGDAVCDVCAAPGGKSFTLSELLRKTGKIYSHDIYENKISIIKSGAQRLGLKNIFASVRDAQNGSCDIKCDRVLCDVPCSGLGIIRRKPDIKNKNPLDIEELPKIQFSILENSADLLKEGGVLVYSTCTLSHKENREVVEKFLSSHPEFEPYPFEAPCERFCGEPGYMLTLFPHVLGTDGFFISRIRKKVLSDA